VNNITAVAIVGSYFSFSYFSIFELFGIRAGVQLVFVVIVCVLCLILMMHVKSIRIDAYAAYLGMLAIFVAINKVEDSILYTLLYSLVVYFVLINSDVELRRKVIKFTSLALMILASLAIVQFFVMLIFGSVIAKDLALFNDAYHGADRIILFDPSAYGTNEYSWLRLLGFTDLKSYKFGLFEFFNVRSFIHEPSLALSIFYLPVVATLVTKCSSRFVSAVILVFCLLTFSWGIYLALAIAVIIKSIMSIRKRFPLMIFSFVFIALLFIYIFIPPDVAYQFDVDKEVKFESNLGRLMVISYALHKEPQLVFGNSDLIRAPLGMMTYSFYYGGAVLFGACCVLFFKIIKWASNINKMHGSQKIGVAMLMSYLMQVLIFNEYGLITPIGIITLGLLYRYLGDQYR